MDITGSEPTQVSNSSQRSIQCTIASRQSLNKLNKLLIPLSEKNVVTCKICLDLVQVVDDALVSNQTIDDVIKIFKLRRFC